MAYPSIPPRPAYDADWTALGDAWHAALTQALSDDPVIRADLTSVKGTVAGLAAGLAPTANPSFTGTVTGISKGMVGLGNVDNTADAAKAIDGAQITSGVLDSARLPAGCAAIRTRLPAGEANPSATNWAARPSGYPIVLSIGAPPGPVDALATDIHVPTATAAAPSVPQPIALTDGSTIPVWTGSDIFDQAQLVGAVTTQVTAQATYDAYTSRLPAAKLLPGFRQMAANACALLYTSMAQVPYKHPNLTLVFSSTSGVLAQTWKSLSKIEFGPLSVGAAVTASYSTHEVVHLFQHSPTNGTTQTSGVIEGIADWVLVQMGYHTAANQRPTGGGTAWDAGYDTTAFFFDWIERTAGGGTPGFVRALNQSLNTATWSSSVITSLNVQGKTVDQLWTDYKAALAPPAVDNTAGWKEVALRITSTAENSTTNWTTAYPYIEDIGDGRGYTAGIVGWCSGTGDMLVLVQYAAQQTPGNLLEKWIPKLQQIMAAAYSQRPSLSNSLLGSAFIADWKTAAAQAWFQAAQRAERDRLYWGPAAAQATTDGVGNCGRAVMYDISVNHGQGSDPESFGGICAAAAAQAKPPSQGGTEKAYLLALCDKRDAVLRSWGDYQSNGRSPAFRNLVNNNMSFTFPITWSMYGSNYSITSLPTGPG